MKKFVMALIACLAIVQASYAATPALTESLLEYEAIITAIGSPSFDVIPVTEFITDIDRLTKQVNILGEVKYKIVTRVPRNGDGEQNGGGCGCHKKKHHNHKRTHIYIATLLVAANPGVGPNIVTVQSIVRKH